ncbi:MAG: YraN family protein [Chloroflexota bacterium]|nr:MAG: YraN family protein [Chloroflexota bacterium]
MTKKRQQLGRWGETKAAEYLEKQGYKIIDRNAYTQYGEIDIVAQQTIKNTPYTIFVEVKTRTTTTFGYPEEAITNLKREHILASAMAYLQENPQLSDNWQVDVIAIRRLNTKTEPEIRHFENVFS